MQSFTHTLTVGAFALSATLAARTAGAHAFLDHADPAVGSTTAESPRAIRLFFTETIEPKFSRISLADAEGAAVPAGMLSSAGDDRSELDLALVSPLAPGRYTVSWRVVSADTHHTEGTFSFEVKP